MVLSANFSSERHERHGFDARRRRKNVVIVEFSIMEAGASMTEKVCFASRLVVLEIITLDPYMFYDEMQVNNSYIWIEGSRLPHKVV